ncbi:MAG: hypothetical protein OEL79_06510, partial [Chromatiales bacterium]|nr:hypothetical protein [Chromatiales bacterium]
LLMDVSNRFGNLMGRVLTPTAGEREIIAAYLVKNALIPMEPISETIKGHAYERHCDNCHVLPDPAQHTFDEWHNVIERMLREMKVMKYSPPSDAEIVEIYNYLRGDVIEEETSRVNDLIEKRVPATELIKTPTISNGTWWAIGPFLLLVLLGVIRWWWSSYVRKSADAS